jgi:lysophospholipase L1-like esterase
MRIALISNLQGTSAGVEPLENYPVVLRSILDRKHELLAFCLSDWSILDFNNHIDLILDTEPELVIAQIGIIECARRILSNRAKTFYRWLPGGRHVTKFLHKHRQAIIRFRTRLGMNAYRISTEEFRKGLESFCNALQKRRKTKILFFKIPRFAKDYEKVHYPYLNEDIDKYNSILREYGAVSIFEEDDDLLSIWQPGTVHFNAEGHERVAERIDEIIDRYLKQYID